MTDRVLYDLLADRRVAVFGGGAPVLPELGRLLAAGALITAVAPEVCPAVEALAAAGRLDLRSGRWREDDLDGVWYAFAGTADPVDDAAIAEAAERRRVFCRVLRGAPAPAAERSTSDGGVALVGAGPGDPDLITVRGRALLAAADVVVVDRLAPLELLADLRPGVEVVDAAKIPHGRAAAQGELNRLLVEHARAGRSVVRLKGGDPYVFGRGFEEVLACAEAGVPVTVVPGVSSALAVPALAGVPVTHRGMTHELTVVSGHLPPTHPDSLVDWAALARLRGTVVVLMGVTHLAGIAEALVGGGRDPSTPALAVQDGGTPAQRVLRSTLAALAGDCSAHGIRPPAVFVVGEVAGLARTAGAGGG
ncbi:uroporphyrinogen-III C-methyltransferase [Saccharothrix algeriensis]|uniref:uroporphyrinogen-III C-methyltransferase n=1 Tax=Saccharothrix algeriensis TaxID=173560 RepID=A0ABS2SFM3_9PSEU|nr:uroporphyrinogen-III C-methyltransferase [Saccharothrix algeriensis]MBM7815058.1 uroporphyrin-III C-methyltransferase/precorrin-2 dehydrogenase/sirohydrochlorin ferrochelatase [Saccharothrix algeriensis]